MTGESPHGYVRLATHLQRYLAAPTEEAALAVLDAMPPRSRALVLSLNERATGADHPPRPPDISAQKLIFDRADESVLDEPDGEAMLGFLAAIEKVYGDA